MRMGLDRICPYRISLQTLLMAVLNHSNSAIKFCLDVTNVQRLLHFATYVTGTKTGRRIYIFQYISNKMQLCTVYLYLETALYVSGGISTHHQERKQLYLQHLVLVTPLLLPAAIAAGSSKGVIGIYLRCTDP
jgi:hypothetical protein